MYVYVYVSVYVYVYVDVCVYIYICLCVYIPLYIYIYMYIYVHVNWMINAWRSSGQWVSWIIASTPQNAGLSATVLSNLEVKAGARGRGLSKAWSAVSKADVTCMFLPWSS